MNQAVRLLSEAESAAVAEVSVATIRKYRDCGLLDPVVKDSQTFFQELDIRTLFFTKFRAKQAEPQKSGPGALASGRQNGELPLNHVKNNTAAEVERNEPQAEPLPVSNRLAVQPEVLDQAGDPQIESPLRFAQEQRTQPIEVASFGPTTSVLTQSSLPSSTELIELNKSLRDQIQILREERNWLRDRVEKLESRSEREQVLLLSESENVRKLIVSTQKSFWQKALPWLSK